MRVLVCAVSNGGGGGGAVVARAAVEALCARPEIERVRLVCPPSLGRFEAAGLERVERAREASSYAARLLYFERGLAREARAWGAHAVLCLNGMGHTPGIPRVDLVQQGFALAPERRIPRELRARMRVVRAMTARSCAGAQAVVVQTSWMAEAVRAAFGVPEGRVRVATPHASWFGAQDGRVAPLTRARRRRVLFVGSALSSKREDVAVAACARLGDVELDVVRAGVGREGVRERMLAAHALIMPSELESMGLPLVEAMSVGLPVAAADRPYAREVCGAAAARFAPGDPIDAARALGEVLRRGAELGALGLERHAELEAARAYDALAAAVVEVAR